LQLLDDDPVELPTRQCKSVSAAIKAKGMAVIDGRCEKCESK